MSIDRYAAFISEQARIANIDQPKRIEEDADSDPLKGKTAEQAFHLGKDHGFYPGNKKLTLPDDHPHKSSYDEGYKLGSKLSGSNVGRD